MASVHGTGRPRGGVVTQRTANPRTPVRFRPWPPGLVSENRHSSAHAETLESALRPFWIRSGFCAKALAPLPVFCYEAGASDPRPFRGSSAVEQPAVNRLVAGSNPARGASHFNQLSLSLKSRTLTGGALGAQSARLSCAISTA